MPGNSSGEPIPPYGGGNSHNADIVNNTENTPSRGQSRLDSADNTENNGVRDHQVLCSDGSASINPNEGEEVNRQNQQGLPAKPYNFDIPIRSSLDKVESYFNALYDAICYLIDDMNNEKKRLIENDLWDICNKLADGKPITDSDKEQLEKYREDKESRINDIISEIKEFKEKHPTTYNPGREDFIQLSRLYRRLNILTSPFYEYVLSNLDQIDIEQFVQKIKDCYQLLTLDDYMDTAHELLQEYLNGNLSIIISSPTEVHDADPPTWCITDKWNDTYKSLIASLDPGSFYDSDLHLLNAVIAIDEKYSKMDVKIGKGISGFLKYVFYYKMKHNLASIKDTVVDLIQNGLVVLIIDDFLGTGTQKAPLSKRRYITVQIKKNLPKDYRLTDVEINELVNLFLKSAKLHVVGSTQKGHDRVTKEGVGVEVKPHKKVGSISEFIDEPYLTLLIHMNYIVGYYYDLFEPYSGDEIYMSDVSRASRIEKVSALIEKGLPVSPFKTFDTLSCPRFFQNPNISKANDLFPRGSDSRAYIPIGYFLDLYPDQYQSASGALGTDSDAPRIQLGNKKGKSSQTNIRERFEAHEKYLKKWGMEINFGEDGFVHIGEDEAMGRNLI